MSVGHTKLLRKRMPRVHALIKSGDWEIAGQTGGGHIWLRHVNTGKKITAPSSAGDVRSEMNLLRYMRQIEGGRQS